MNKSSQTKSTPSAEKKASPFRIVLGIFVAWIVTALYALSLSFTYISDGTAGGIEIVIVEAILFTFVLLYLYGWLGMFVIDLCDAQNIFLRIFGYFFGYIGMVIRPFVVKAYGANKKSIFIFCTAIPWLVIAVVGVFVGLFAGLGDLYSVPCYFVAASCAVNAFFAFMTKKCPNCKRMMTNIDMEVVDRQSANYTQTLSQEVGSVGEDSIYVHYDVEFSGKKDLHAKTYTCACCGTKKHTFKIRYFEKDFRDPTKPEI